MNPNSNLPGGVDLGKMANEAVFVKKSSEWLDKFHELLGEMAQDDMTIVPIVDLRMIPIAGSPEFRLLGQSFTMVSVRPDQQQQILEGIKQRKLMREQKEKSKADKLEKAREMEASDNNQQNENQGAAN